MDRRRSPRLTEMPGLWRRRCLAAGVAGAAQLVMAGALIWAHLTPPPAKPPAPVTLMVSVKPTPQPLDPTELAPGLPDIVAPTPPTVAIPLVTIAHAPATDTSDLLNDSQLAGAASAGQGGRGRCDTASIVQQVLRRDPRVRAAVENADRLGKASMLWNGDWVRAGGQEGKGLAVVRQAIIWEVAFEPEACRNERMHGMVLLSLSDGRTRFAIGAGEWRWSDLLGLKSLR